MEVEKTTTFEEVSHRVRPGGGLRGDPVWGGRQRPGLPRAESSLREVPEGMPPQELLAVWFRETLPHLFNLYVHSCFIHACIHSFMDTYSKPGYYLL